MLPPKEFLINWISQHTIHRKSVVEFGCMFYEMLSYVHPTVQHKIGIELHLPYIEDPRTYQYCTHIHGDMRHYRDLIPRQHYDLAMSIDTLEHLTKDDGLKLIHNLQEDFNKVIIFTPLGLINQTEDLFHLGADELQTHKSGWQPEELKQLGFNTYVYPNFHSNLNPPESAIFAEWNK